MSNDKKPGVAATILGVVTLVGLVYFVFYIFAISVESAINALLASDVAISTQEAMSIVFVFIMCTVIWHALGKVLNDD